MNSSILNTTQAAAAGKITDPTHVDGLTMRLDSLAAQSISNLGRLQSIVDLAFGPRPQPDSKPPQGEMAANGCIQELGIRVTKLEGMTDIQTSLISELEKIF